MSLRIRTNETNERDPVSRRSWWTKTQSKRNTVGDTSSKSREHQPFLMLNVLNTSSQKSYSLTSRGFFSFRQGARRSKVPAKLRCKTSGDLSRLFGSRVIPMRIVESFESRPYAHVQTHQLPTPTCSQGCCHLPRHTRLSAAGEVARGQPLPSWMRT